MAYRSPESGLCSLSKTIALAQPHVCSSSAVWVWPCILRLLESPFLSLLVFLSLHHVNFLSLCLLLPVPGHLCFPLDFTCLLLSPAWGAVVSADEWLWLCLILPVHLSPSFSFISALVYTQATLVTSVTPQGLKPHLCDFVCFGVT